MIEKKEILDNAHLNCVKDLARKYFRQSGIDFTSLITSDFCKLGALIQVEIDKLSSDSKYQMIPKLKIRIFPKKNKDGVFLRISGSYFSDREGISFHTDHNRDFLVGFCAEMDGCNQTPFIVGFVKWVDYLLDNIKEINLQGVNDIKQ